MPSRAPRAVGVIEMEPRSSRVETFFDSEDGRTCADALAQLARGCNTRDDSHDDTHADVVIAADTARLAADLEAEYAALRAAIAAAR